MEKVNILKSSILAGIFISLGGAVFLKVGGIIGAVLFAFGLLSVVHYKLKLYTGTAGFFAPNKTSEWINLLLIIVGNIIGCLLVGMLIKQASPDSVQVAESILQKRLASGWFNCMLLAIGCGFIMTTAVEFGRQEKYLPLLFGVPLFIMCGFAHSIADAFYFLANPFSALGSIDVLMVYLSEVVGNFIGCNLYRAVWIGKK